MTKNKSLIMTVKFPKILMVLNKIRSVQLIAHPYSNFILHGDGAFDGGVGVVSLESEIFVAEIEYGLYVGIDHHSGEGAGCACQLEVDLIKMVGVNMRVAECMDEISGTQSAYLSHHHGQQRITGDIERHSEETVGTALIKLT